MLKAAITLLSLFVLAQARVVSSRSPESDEYVQNASGIASFTMYDDCSKPACGITASGYVAAVSQLTFGAPPGVGPGDACGRCFSITANKDPYDPTYTGPFRTIVVKVTDLCPIEGNGEWCGHSRSRRNNTHGSPVHFDICTDTGGARAFFPLGHGALTGNYTEVPCSMWDGTDGQPIWEGACLSGERAPNWPSRGCGNQGTAP